MTRTSGVEEGLRVLVPQKEAQSRALFSFSGQDGRFYIEGQLAGGHLTRGGSQVELTYREGCRTCSDSAPSKSESWTHKLVHRRRGIAARDHPVIFFLWPRVTVGGGPPHFPSFPPKARRPHFLGSCGPGGSTGARTRTAKKKKGKYSIPHLGLDAARLQNSSFQNSSVFESASTRRAGARIEPTDGLRLPTCVYQGQGPSARDITRRSRCNLLSK